MTVTHDNNITEVLNSGMWFPERIDWTARTVVFRELDLDVFARVPFHDGRIAFFSPTSPRVMSFAQLIDHHRACNSKSKNRLLLHQSFCGSTLLAQMLSLAPIIVSYREPQILIDLADHSTTDHSDDLASAIMAQFQISPTNDGVSIVKPSNWINPWISRNAVLNDSLIILIAIDLRAFLLANLRGGKLRIGYSLNLLNRALSRAPDWVRFVPQAQDLLATAPLEATLRMLALLHAIQSDDFVRIVENQPDNCVCVSYDQIRNQPIETAQQSALWLQLNISEKLLIDHCNRLTSRHAKSASGAHFNADTQNESDETLGQQFDNELNRTLNWHSTITETHRQNK